ncbi:MAG: tripartite tricarboxylate transporter TctB family protein [Rhodoplanes sp.]
MTDNSHSGEAGPSHRAVEVGVAVAMLLFASVVIYGAWLAGINWGAEGPRAGFFPFYVGLSIALASAFNLWRALAIDGERLFAEWGQLRQVMSVVIPTAIYVALVPWLGLYVASFLLIAVFMKWLGKYSWMLTLAVAIGVPVLSFLMFEKWFLVPLPKGPLEDSLGL